VEIVPFLIEVSEEQIRRERQKARQLRESPGGSANAPQASASHCGKKCSPKELTMDHLVPIVRGGKSIKGNLVPAAKRAIRNEISLPFESSENVDCACGIFIRFTKILAAGGRR
jgi:hypothetical protein